MIEIIRARNPGKLFGITRDVSTRYNSNVMYPEMLRG